MSNCISQYLSFVSLVYKIAKGKLLTNICDYFWLYSTLKYKFPNLRFNLNCEDNAGNSFWLMNEKKNNASVARIEISGYNLVEL